MKIKKIINKRNLLIFVHNPSGQSQTVIFTHKLNQTTNLVLFFNGNQDIEIWLQKRSIHEVKPTSRFTSQVLKQIIEIMPRNIAKLSKLQRYLL